MPGGLRPAFASMTFEDFMAFVDERPDDERWELVDGVPVLSPTPNRTHQVIVTNLVAFLMTHKNQRGSGWLPLPGHLVPAPPLTNSATFPDVVVVPDEAIAEQFSPDPIVAVEVLSRSNTRADRLWRMGAYTSGGSIQHYLEVEQRRARIVLHSRSEDWMPVELEGIGAVADLPALGVTIPLAVIYQWTGFDAKGRERHAP